MNAIAGKLFGIRKNDRVRDIPAQQFSKARSELTRTFAQICQANLAISTGS